MIVDYKPNPDRFPEVMQKLSDEKMYLYGNGKYAEEMRDILDKFHITIDGVLVSKSYYKKGNFGGDEIYEAETFLENVQEMFAIVSGFNVLIHKELTEKLVAEKCVKLIYVLNGIQVLWNNGFHFLNPKVYLIDNYYEVLVKRNLNYEYFKNNYALFTQTYDWLEDEKSKKIMEDYLRGHIELTNFPMQEVWETTDGENQYFPRELYCDYV